ncbi:hypothetical protein V2J09_020784 [Rumex salicifolius]
MESEISPAKLIVSWRNFHGMKEYKLQRSVLIHVHFFRCSYIFSSFLHHDICSSGSGPTNTDDTANSRSSASLLYAVLGDSANIGLQFPSFTLKLDRSNYFIWHSNILDALAAFGLRDFVLSGIAPPATVTTEATTDTVASATTNPDFLLWTRRDKLILIWLRTTISPPLLGYVARSDSSRQAWLTIERMFQAHSHACSMQLKQQLNFLKKGDLPMVEYFEQKHSLQPVSDDDFVACVLHGLDPSYGPFKAAIYMWLDPISSEDLLGYLLREEECLREESLYHTGPSSSHYSQSRNSSSQRRSECPSHPSSDWSNSSDQPPSGRSDSNGSSSQTSQTRTRLICQLCEKPGHAAKDYFNRTNFQGFPARHTADRFIASSGGHQQQHSHHKGYVCYDPTTIKSYISHHVVFHESSFPSIPSSSTSSPSSVTPTSSSLLQVIYTHLSPSSTPSTKALVNGSGELSAPASSLAKVFKSENWESEMLAEI